MEEVVGAPRFELGTPSMKWAALDHAIELLMLAATSGKREDIKAAADQLEIVLRAQRLL